MSKTWIEHSRTAWRNPDDASPSDDRIKIGCLQRIANATEKMAASYDKLRNERDYYKRLHEVAHAAIVSLRRSNAALRGCLRRMKKGGQA